MLAIVAEISGDQISIAYSASDRVCILAHAHAAPNNPDTELANLRLYSSKNDYHLVPIARSYHQFPWRNTAGKFADQSIIDSCVESDATSTCTIILPMIDESLRVPDGKFILLGFEHSLKNFNEVLSRFFSRTTFGPTMDMINSFKHSYENNLTGMATWLKQQIRDVPATLHRVYWRERLHHGVQGDLTQTFYMRKPCDAYSIWYDYAFDEKDWDGAIDGTKMNVQYQHYNGKHLVSVNGVPRTLLDQPLVRFGTNGQLFQYGTYKIHSASFGSYLGGPVRLLGMGVDSYIEGGNPAIKLPSTILNNSNFGFYQVNLPGSKEDTSNFDYIPPILTRYEFKGKAGYRLKVNINGNGCDALADERGQSGNVVGKLPNYGSTNAILRHGANIIMKENSLENPCVGADCGIINNRMHPRIEDTCVIDSQSMPGTTEIKCGSAGEVANKLDQDPTQVNIFVITNLCNIFYWNYAIFSKIYIWHTIAQTRVDQLRQHVS